MLYYNREKLEDAL